MCSHCSNHCYECLQKDMLGAYPFSSSKAARKQTAVQGHCVAHMFVMHVAEELPTWPEGSERKRVWVSPDLTLHHAIPVSCWLLFGLRRLQGSMLYLCVHKVHLQRVLSFIPGRAQPDAVKQQLFCFDSVHRQSCVLHFM